MLESVPSIDAKYHNVLYLGEWIITVFFTIEYMARIIAVKRAKSYVFSFYGFIDLLSTIPLYLSFIFAGSSYLIAVRALRLLRIFRILKLMRYVGEATKLQRALLLSRPKILVFLFPYIL